MLVLGIWIVKVEVGLWIFHEVPGNEIGKVKGKVFL
jgi:hypothetical protein